MAKDIRQGEVYWLDFGLSSGSAPAERRPCVVVQSDVFNRTQIATTVVCKGDNGHWQTNYSGLGGGLAAGGISNLYYPASNRSGLALSFENAGIGTAESAVQNLFQEFVVRKLTPRIPNYGSPKP